MLAVISVIDRLSTAIGKAFGWYILILTFGTTYEVFARYVMDNPTDWNYDLSYNMYGTLFIMAGAYTLSRNAHVRGDVIYRLWPVKFQAGMDLTLYILFFYPGVLALTFAGYIYASKSWHYHELSIYSPVDIPIFPLKTLIPIAGVTLLIQGAAEVMRCLIALKTGEWPQRAQDVEELETAILHEREFIEEHDAEVAATAKEQN